MKNTWKLLALSLVLAPCLDASSETGPGDTEEIVTECQPVGGYLDEASLAGADVARLSPVEISEIGLVGLDLEDPQIQASSCQISLNCGDGNVVACSGNYQCLKSTGQCFVQCDGIQHSCPNACTVYAGCGGGGAVFCTSCSGNCQQGSESVTCDGNTYNCPDPPPRPRRDS